MLLTISLQSLCLNEIGGRGELGKHGDGNELGKHGDGNELGKHVNDAGVLGYLLHKHPDRWQTFPLSFGDCHVFYPENSSQQCTVCLLLDVDPVGMARGKQRQHSFALGGYVNDRPFVASSFLSNAISQVLGTAMNGRCDKLPTLADTPLPLNISIDVLPVRGGESFLRRVFEPLGYHVEAKTELLDAQFPDWGTSPYFSVRLTHTLRLSEALNHLYVLIPVFDFQKHYFVGPDELDKLLNKGSGWLATHPERESITHRYLKFQSGLAREALQRLTEEVAEDINETEGIEANEATNPIDAETAASAPTLAEEESPSLHERRLDFVCEKLIQSNASRVIDLGCGEGKLLRRLLKQRQFKEIVGMDVAVRSLEIAAKRLRIDELPSFQADRLRLLHGSLMYRDQRLAGFDAAAIVEVIEHLDSPRLAAFERVVFEHARPKTIVLTTPNADYNVMWPEMKTQFRHPDHRFEWTRSEFEAWANNICQLYQYSVEVFPVGPVAENVGAPTQMGVFTLS